MTPKSIIVMTLEEYGSRRSVGTHLGYEWSKVHAAGDPHHHDNTLAETQSARKTATMSIAIRQGLRLPVPIPNA